MVPLHLVCMMTHLFAVGSNPQGDLLNISTEVILSLDPALESSQKGN